MHTAHAGMKRSAQPPQAPPKVTIIEVTYQCDHTPPGATPQGRHQNKSQQHAATKSQLESRGHQVDYCVLALGRMGTIHLETRRTAAALGIKQPTALLQKLHTHAVKALHTIVQTRRRLERQRGREQQRPP